MKFSTFRRILLAVVTALLLVGIGGAIWIGVRSSPPQAVGNADANPETAMFVPRHAPLMASLLVNPEQLEFFAIESLPPDQRRSTRGDLGQMRRQLEAQLGLDYERDIFPWAGNELTLALTTWDVDHDPVNGKQPGYLLAIAVWDADEASRTLQRLWQQQAGRGDRLIFEDYSGVSLVYPDTARETDPGDRTRATTPALATAQVGESYVLFSNSPMVLQDAINNVQVPNLSLGSSPAYQEALATLPSKRFGLLWVDLHDLNAYDSNQNLIQRDSGQNAGLGDAESRTAATQASGSASSAQRPSEQNSLLGSTFHTLISSLAIAPAGVVIDTTLIPPPSASTTAESTSEPSISESALAENSASNGPDRTVDALGLWRYIPTESALVIAGRELGDRWRSLVAAADRGEPLAQWIVESLSARQTEWGIDLSTDVLPWMQGEFALAQIPTAESKRSDALLIAQSSAAAAEGVSHLDAIAQAQGLSVGPLQVGNQTTTIWTRLKALFDPENSASPITLSTEVKGIHATVDEYEVLATSVQAIGASLVAEQDSFATSDRVQRAIAALDSAHDGLLYAEWPLAQALFIRELPVIEPLLQSMSPLLTYVQSIMISPDEDKGQVGNEGQGQKLGAVVQFVSAED